MRIAAFLLACVVVAVPADGRRRVARHPGPPSIAAQPVVYVVEIRSFADSNGDGIGDLAGLRARLDYLDDLGVDVLLLLAPLEASDISDTFYGFGVTDFESIESDFGTNTDFEQLIADAHARGMKVMIDLMLNHTASTHPWRLQHSDWYVFFDGAYPAWPSFDGSTDSAWHPINVEHTRWIYALFGGGRPDLNYNVPAVQEEMKRIGALWLARGVDGFRLPKVQFLVETGPAAGQIDTPETHAVLQSFAAAMRAVKPDVLLVADNRQVDTPALVSYFGDVAMSFDYPLAVAARETLSSRNADPLAAKLREIEQLFPANAAPSPFLSHFDRTRLATLLGDDPARLRVATSLLFTLPGIPFLYYGEEIGMPSGDVPVQFHGLPDSSARRPMRWNATPNAGFTTGTPWISFGPASSANVADEMRDSTSLLWRTRELIHLRREHDALAGNRFEVLNATPLLAWIRTSDTERVLVVHNVRDTSSSAILTLNAMKITALFVDAGATLDANGLVTMPPSSTGIWKLQ